jgi:starvation-inducible DNA-binding protein
MVETTSKRSNIMPTTGNNSRAALVEGLNGLLADHIALWLKTKNFHWHVTGARFRELHLMFDEQALEVQAQIDLIAERVRKNNAPTLTSLATVAAVAAVQGQDSAALAPEAMIAELLADNEGLVERLKALKEAAGKAGDNASEGLIDGWTDMAEQRAWFLRATLG